MAQDERAAPERTGRRSAVAGRLLGALAAVAAVAGLLRAVRRTRPLRREWTTIAGIAGARPLRIHAWAGGAAAGGPPVVLVEGFGIGSSYLLPLAARLAEEVPVFAPDLPGHGPSDHDARPLSFPELGRALGSWMDARGLNGALLAGHSSGCQVCVEAALRRPDLVAGLVLIGPTSDPAARTAGRELGRGFLATLFDRPTDVLRGLRDYARAGPRLLAHEMRQMNTLPVEQLLPHLRVPVRVVRGGRDRIAPQRWAETVARLAGAPPPTVVPGWGHAVQYDDPGGVGRVVLDLARALAARPVP